MEDVVEVVVGVEIGDGIDFTEVSEGSSTDVGEGPKIGEWIDIVVRKGCWVGQAKVTKRERESPEIGENAPEADDDDF